MSTTLGSQRLLQAAVHSHDAVIDPIIRSALRIPSSTGIEWRSPRQSDDFREYRDGAALAKLGAQHLGPALRLFWPARGPVWDGLARTDSGKLLLVEAKAHIAELASPGTKATVESLRQIDDAFAEVRRAIAPRSSSAWTSTFYQYANRLAFLYFLRKNGLDAHLLHVLFLNADQVGGPRSADEWAGALQLLRAALGLSDHKLKPFVHDIVIDASLLRLPPIQI